MASTSQSAAGTPSSGSYPMLLELPSQKDFPKPQPEWENPTKGACPKCLDPVWFHKLIHQALMEPQKFALCKKCLDIERERQSRT